MVVDMIHISINSTFPISDQSERSQLVRQIDQQISQVFDSSRAYAGTRSRTSPNRAATCAQMLLLAYMRARMYCMCTPMYARAALQYPRLPYIIRPRLSPHAPGSAFDTCLFFSFFYNILLEPKSLREVDYYR